MVLTPIDNPCVHQLIYLGVINVNILISVIPSALLVSIFLWFNPVQEEKSIVTLKYSPCWKGRIKTQFFP